MSIELTLGDLQEIELVLIEASAWGLQIEVEETAQNYIKEGFHPLDAYHSAYDEWVK